MPTAPIFRRTVLFLATCAAVLACATPGHAQSARADSLEAWMRRGYALGNPGAAAVWREIGWNGVGFGFRSFAARKPMADDAAAQSIQGFGASMEYYRIALNELHVEVHGDIGLAWGVHTEEFKVKDQPAESVRVRFTNTLRWDGSTWRNLLYHRDAQPFDEKGVYIRSPR